MAYAIELFFEPEMDSKIRKVWSSVSKKAVLKNRMADQGSRPHLSLAVFKSAPLDLLTKALDEMVLNHAPFSVRFDSVGMFPGKAGVIFLGPALNRELLKIHADCHQRLRGMAEGMSEHYLPGRLVFHSTLNMNLKPAQLTKAASASLGIKLPIVGQAVEIGLIEVPEMKLVKTAALTQN